MKHAQTIGLLEQPHASANAQLEAATGEFRNETTGINFSRSQF